MKALLCVPLALLASACAGSGALSRGDAAFRRGEFARAAREYEAAVAARPGDPKAAAALLSARRAGGLERARGLFLAGACDGALAILDPLAAEDPADALAAAWRAKVRLVVADAYVERGRDALSTGDYPAARLAFERALETYPGHEGAEGNLAALEKEVGRREALSTGYYFSGMRALGEDRLEESRSGFQKSLKYDREHPRAELRDREVARRLAAGRLLAAEAFAAEGRFAAAHREASLAAALDPGLGEAKRLRQEMAAEVEVAGLAARADLELARGQPRAARASLEIAIAKTASPAVRERLQERLRRLAEDDLEALYLAALDLENDRRLEAAGEAYARLLERTPHYRDAIARLENLRALLARVEALYREALSAEEAGDAGTARARLDEVSNLHPEYRDVAERRASLARKEGASPANGSAPAPR